MNWLFGGYIQAAGERGKLPLSSPAQKVSLCTTRATKRRAGLAAKQQILVPPGIDETSEWHNRFLLIPKANGKVRLCLDPASLNKVIIRLILGGLILNNIISRLAGVKYIMLNDASSGYHNLKVR